MAGDLPDLTGMSARERRIFAMGANWGVAQATASVAAVMRQWAALPAAQGAPAGDALREAADAVAAVDSACIIRGLNAAGLLA